MQCVIPTELLRVQIASGRAAIFLIILFKNIECCGEIRKFLRYVELIDTNSNNFY